MQNNLPILISKKDKTVIFSGIPWDDEITNIFSIFSNCWSYSSKSPKVTELGNAGLTITIWDFTQWENVQLYMKENNNKQKPVFKIKNYTSFNIRNVN